MPRALILGATGLLGSALHRGLSAMAGFQVAGASLSGRAPEIERVDVRDAAAVADLIARVKPTHVVHAAADPHVDGCELRPEETRAINVDGARNVLRAARQADARVVFFSSDYVFDGSKEPYSEDDPPCPMNEYGRQKLSIERDTIAADGAVVRVSGLYGVESRGKNFVYQVLKKAAAGEAIKLPTDQFYNPTYVEDVVAAVASILRDGRRGIYHAVGPDRVSRVQFATAIAELFGLREPRFQPVRLADLASPTPRPLCTSLSNEKARRELSIRFSGIREGLARMRDALGAAAPTSTAPTSGDARR